MRRSAFGGVAMLGVLSCAKVEPEGTAARPLPPATATGGSGASGPVGSGGTTLNVGGGGSGGAPTPSEILTPVYDRDCITARLGRTRDASSTARIPLGPDDPAVDAGRKPDGGVDLELGAGDLTLLVVFDRSGSMGDGWDGRSKWQVANTAFLEAIAPVVDNLTIGTLFFPQPDACDVAPLESPLQMNYAPGHAFATNWKATEATRQPNGSTPLALAFTYADKAIEQACRLGLLDDRFRVVLLTDGAPTCDGVGHDRDVVEQAAEWNRIGVETWVMGLPGSAGAGQLLDAIARAGGTGTAQVLGTPTALSQGLAAAAR